MVESVAAVRLSGAAGAAKAKPLHERSKTNEIIEGIKTFFFCIKLMFFKVFTKHKQKNRIDIVMRL